MIRPLIILALALSLSGCEKAEIDRNIALLSGTSDAVEQQAYLVVPPSSSEEITVAVEPSVPEVCETHDWHTYLYDCHDNYLGLDPVWWGPQ